MGAWILPLHQQPDQALLNNGAATGQGRQDPNCLPRSSSSEVKTGSCRKDFFFKIFIRDTNISILHKRRKTPFLLENKICKPLFKVVHVENLQFNKTEKRLAQHPLYFFIPVYSIIQVLPQQADL